MKMNRRNVLVGLGTIVAGGGAALGTGAFSTVQATRTVDLNTTGDSGALLSLADGGSELVSTDSGDQLQLSSDSLNQDALTRADGAIEVTNTGADPVGFYVQENSFSVLDFEVGGTSIVGTGGSVDLAASSGSVSVDLVIDLQGDTVDETSIAGEVTFVADTEQHSGGS